MNSIHDKKTQNGFDPKTAVIFMADGMEMCECLLTVDILRRAKVNVITASVMGRKEITTSHKVTLYADILAEDIDYNDVNLIVLPGGRVGTENLTASATVREQCLAFAAAGADKNGDIESGSTADTVPAFCEKEKYLAAICAAPSLFAGLGILNGRKATCHPDFEAKTAAGSGSSFICEADRGSDSIPAADDTEMNSPAAEDTGMSSPVELTHESVTVCGNIITGQALGATMDFALCLAEILTDPETADKIAASICYARD